MNNLGLAWSSLGDYRKAIDYYTEALAIDQKVYTPHPSVAIRLNNLGEAWRGLGEYRKAIDYYTKALAMLQVTLPADHPHVVVMRANLAKAEQAKAAAQ